MRRHDGPKALQRGQPGRTPLFVILLACALCMAVASPVGAAPKRSAAKKPSVKRRAAKQASNRAAMKRRCRSARQRRGATCRAFAKREKTRAEARRLQADRRHCAKKSHRRSRRCKRFAHQRSKRRLRSRICGRGYGRARNRERVRDFARRHRVAVGAIRAWNGLGGAARLRKGKRYIVRKSPLEGQRLVGGALLQAERGLLTLQRPQRGWGRPVTVQAIRSAAQAVQRSWPESNHLIVGDLSQRGGGCLPPHKSHRGGLDADIGYFQRDNKRRDWMTLASPTSIDAKRTWLFLKALLASGRVRYAFIDYGLQVPLYEAARLAGEATETLSRVFQYPRPRSANRAAIFRHLRGHADHMHVRFTCPDSGSCSLPPEAIARMTEMRLEQKAPPPPEGQPDDDGEDAEGEEAEAAMPDDALPDDAPPPPAKEPPARDPAPPPGVLIVGGVPARSAP